ncbi:MAG: exodeoxyribonuclease VII large subunit [Thermodesulfobacteriota bacterium]
MPHVFTVRELTSAVGEVLGGQFPFVWVRGQVGSLSRPASGHVYFTLRDADAVLSVVWFRHRRREGAGGGVDPLTGEVLDDQEPFTLAEGMEVLAAGRIGVYAPRGVYQLVAELVQEYGVGDLHLRFEALKQKLAARGFFDQARKRSLPPHPDRVAVVTSPEGAAIRDFLRIAGERGRGASIRIHPTLVQGPSAPEQIVAAMQQAAADGWAEVVVLIRGGGSLEDLWAFNEEAVAEAVFRCPLPVMAGIGHEKDVSLADLVADLRAATPSHAAQLLWPERLALAQQVDGLETALLRSFSRFLAGRETGLERLSRALAWLSPQRRLERLEAAFVRETRALDRAARSLLDRAAAGLDRAAVGLERAFGPGKVEERAGRFEALARRLEPAAEAMARRREHGLALAEARLSALDPEAPLARGYSLVTVRRTGRFLRDPGEVSPGDGLDIRTRGGRVAARVEPPEESREESREGGEG